MCVFIYMMQPTLMKAMRPNVQANLRIESAWCVRIVQFTGSHRKQHLMASTVKEKRMRERARLKDKSKHMFLDEKTNVADPLGTLHKCTSL